jgi:hypothetical protein
MESRVRIGNKTMPIHNTHPKNLAITTWYVVFFIVIVGIVNSIPMLRIRIRDPMPFDPWIWDPE